MASDIYKPILFCSILDYGKGSKILKLSKELGAIEGTILLGKGTIKNQWLNKLGFVEARKEIFITMIDKAIEDDFYKKVSDKFSLEKPHHGIAFSMPLKNCATIDDSKYLSNRDKKGVDNMDYESIVVIADKDDLDDVLDAADEAGSTGGTIIHGRGAGTKEKAILFNIEIEPEKIIVLILSQVEKTEKIVNSIKDKLNMGKPNTGIIFTMDVSRTLGLYKE